MGERESGPTKVSVEVNLANHPSKWAVKLQ